MLHVSAIEVSYATSLVFLQSMEAVCLATSAWVGGLGLAQLHLLLSECGLIELVEKGLGSNGSDKESFCKLAFV